MSPIYFTCCFILLFLAELSGQIPTNNSNFVHSDYDYFSVEAHGKNAPLSGPFLNLLSNDVIQFEFDVFTAPDNDLHYSVFHCDPFWNIDDSNPSDVIQGFISQRIPFPENSIHTFAAFDHYRFELPNTMTRFIQSGNYYVAVHEGNEYNESTVRLGFRMVVYVEGDFGLNAAMEIKRASTIQHLQTHQEVDFSISLANTPVYDMSKVVPVILQNGRWKDGRMNFQPTYIQPNNILVYDFSNGENEFPGGGEWEAFETKDLRVNGYNVQSNIILENENHIYLYPSQNEMNLAYTSRADLNGASLIASDMYEDDDLTSDYTYVHFELNSSELPNRVFLECGNDWNAPVLCEYSEVNKAYQATMYLKQGVYNYRFRIEPLTNNEEVKFAEGNHSSTENNYQLLVYYYDRNAGFYKCGGNFIQNSRRN
ncbi:MAG: hypothetical protein RJA38_1177 [Bacteroidota bacterium]|jgi:hypothetical protein